jgi:hypothetical protein
VLARRGVSNEAREHFPPRAHRVHGQLIRDDDGLSWAGDARITSPISHVDTLPGEQASVDCKCGHLSARACTRRVRIHLDLPPLLQRQRNCRSSGKVLNLKIVFDWFSGAISPMAKYWTTKAGHARRGRRRAKV